MTGNALVRVPQKHTQKAEDRHFFIGGGAEIGIAAGAKESVLTTIGKAAITIVIMGVNAFVAAIATQVYKIFTKRWREGGGSEIPVINTAPGNGSQSSSSPSGQPSSGPSVSPEFLNRYRD